MKKFAVKSHYPLSSCSGACILRFVVDGETTGSVSHQGGFQPFLHCRQTEEGPELVLRTTLQIRREQVESRGGSFRTVKPDVVTHAFNLSTWEAEMSSRPAWSRD